MEKSVKEQAPPPGPPPKGVLRDYLETIVVCVLVLLFARNFVFMQSKVPTGSMLDTLLIGDYILVDRFVFGAPGDAPHGWMGQRQIRRGDVMVFCFPQDPDIDYVKRVIGLPGDTVEMIAGYMYVNGQPLVEPYVLPQNIDPQAHFGPVKTPSGTYFMMGDNRANSVDSRFWGPLPRALVKGRAFFIWYSYEEAPDDYRKTGLDRAISIVHKIVTFPWRTRWGRLFSRVH